MEPGKKAIARLLDMPEESIRGGASVDVRISVFVDSETLSERIYS